MQEILLTASKRILERMVGKIIISEIVTDASAAVVALVKMKGMYGLNTGHKCDMGFNIASAAYNMRPIYNHLIA